MRIGLCGFFLRQTFLQVRQTMKFLCTIFIGKIDCVGFMSFWMRQKPLLYTTDVLETLIIYSHHGKLQTVYEVNTMFQLNDLIHHRDVIRKMISLVYNQFSAERYKHFLKYSWYKAGYVTDRPPHFQSSVQFCFSCEIKNCSAKNPINHFLRCAIRTLLLPIERPQLDDKKIVPHYYHIFKNFIFQFFYS